MEENEVAKNAVSFDQWWQSKGMPAVGEIDPDDRYMVGAYAWAKRAWQEKETPVAL